MPSHVRILLLNGLSIEKGQKAKNTLMQLSGMPVRTIQDAVRAFKTIPPSNRFKLWVGRERRNLRKGKSQYRQALRKIFGHPLPIGNGVFLGGGQNAPRANQPRGHAPAVAGIPGANPIMQYNVVQGGWGGGQPVPPINDEELVIDEQL